MSRKDEIETVIDTFLYNPFDVSASDRQKARQLIDDLDVGASVSRLLRNGDDRRAKSLILAVGHAQAATVDRAEQVLGHDVLPTNVLRKLPRPRGAYLRICMAAGRSYRLLRQIRGESPLMQKTRRETWAACFGHSLLEVIDLEQVIRDHDVLILGETGTGKEHFARAMMAATPGDPDGNAAPSAAINAAAIPDALVESELFGHIKGSFTGATETRSGRIRSADGGAFFLDEVGDLPRTTQVKLLRVIETDEVYPVGSDGSHRADVRYIAATHKDLESMTEGGDFRRDLFERLAGNVIRIAPLRDRPEDVTKIGETFIRRYLSEKTHRERIAHIDSWLSSREARNYNWPGNVRELQNALRNMILGLPPGLKTGNYGGPTLGTGIANSEVPHAIVGCTASLEAVEDWYIHRVLEQSDNNYSQSARILGLDRSTVKRRTSPKSS